jgi:flagellin-like protein
MKLTQQFSDRGVSPVIGVILMVAITVILAAVIGTFVLGLGSGQSANPSAGVDYDPGTDTLTVTTVDRADEITVEWGSDSGTLDPPSAGDTLSFTDSSVGGSGSFSGGTVTVTATYEGKTTVLTTFEDTTG